MRTDYYFFSGDRVRYSGGAGRDQYGTVEGRATYKRNTDYYPVRLDNKREAKLLPGKHLTPVGARENPTTTVSLMDSAILVGVGVIVGGVAYWLYAKSQENAAASAVDPQNVPPGQIDPVTGTTRLGPGGSNQPVGPVANT